MGLRVNDLIEIGEDELHEDFERVSGPGGQHVNKVETGVVLKFDAARSTALPDEVKTRLAKVAGKRMTEAGVLVIHARRYRSRERNRVDARQRLVVLVQRACEKPKKRVASKPTAAAKRARLEDKKRQSLKKRHRRSMDHED
ncbi:MAG: aminoacyl-tRNA hydrolase [Acidobacteria bacterium]|nr:aminoacyl-tRNA hydrolase [Acidobacteriota bacterium]